MSYWCVLMLPQTFHVLCIKQDLVCILGWCSTDVSQLNHLRCLQQWDCCHVSMLQCLTRALSTTDTESHHPPEQTLGVSQLSRLDRHNWVSYVVFCSTLVHRSFVHTLEIVNNVQV